jgi:hypothetical protein
MALEPGNQHPFSIEAFKANFAGGGARPNLFKVIITFPEGATDVTELTSFLCKTASLPAIEIGEINIPWKGRQAKYAGDRTFGDWSVTIFNDIDFKIRDAFENWINIMNNLDTNQGTEDPSKYKVADAEVHQLDREGNVAKIYKMIGIWPKSVGEIALDVSSGDSIEEFTVTFAVDSYSSIPAGTTNTATR